MSRFLRFFLFYLVLFVSLSGKLAATTWYSKAATDPSNLANWSLNSDGTGGAPGNFTTAGDLFIIQMGHNLTLGAAWDLGAGAAVNLQIDGSLNSTNRNITVGGTTLVNGSFTDNNNAGTNTFTGAATIAGTFSVSSSSNSTFGSSLTINFGGSATISGGNITVTGVFLNDGSFTDNNNTGTDTFNGLITSTGTFNTSAVTTAARVLFNAGFTNSTGATFTVNACRLTGTFIGTQAMTFPAAITTNGAVILDGTVNFTGSGTVAFGNTLTVAATGTVTVSTTAALTVTSTTTILGSFTDNDNTASSTFTGLVTLTSGTLDLSALSTANCIMNSGVTYTAGTFNVPNVTLGATSRIITATSPISWSANNIAFSGAAAATTFAGVGGTTISGTAALAIPQNLSITGGLTISTTGAFSVTGTTSITGSGSFTDSDNSSTSTFTGLVTQNGASTTWTTTAVTTAANMLFSAGYTNTAGTCNMGAISMPTGQTLTGTNLITINNGWSIGTTGNVSIAGAQGVTLAGTGINYSVPGTLSVSGLLTVSTTGDFTVVGTTSLTGGFTDNENSGITTFTGLLTKTGGGTFNSTAVTTAANMNFPAGVTGTATWNCGAATIGAGQTITANGAMNFAGAIVCPGSLVITGAGLVTNSAGNSAITTNLTTGAGGFTKSGGDLTVGGNLNWSAGTVTVSTTGNFTVTGTTGITGTGVFLDNENTGISTFTGLVTKNSSGAWTSSVVTTATNMVFSSGFTNTLGAFNGGAATIGAGQTITPTVTMTFAGELDCPGNLIIANGAVVVNSAGISDITGDLTIGSGGFTKSGGDLNVGGNLAWSAGTVTISTTGNFTVTGTTSITGSGSFAESNNTGVTTFTGLVTQNTSGTWTSTTVSTATNLVFSNGVTNTAGTFTAGAATIGAGKTITPTTAMSFSGEMDCPGNLIIANGALITNSGGTSDITGDLTLGNGGLTKSGGNLNVGGNLSWSAGSALTLSTTGSVTITGTTIIPASASVIDNQNTGITTFTGLVTTNGGTFNSTGVTTNTQLVFDGGYTHTSGTFTCQGATAQGTLTPTTAMTISSGGLRAKNTLYIGAGLGVTVSAGGLTSSGVANVELNTATSLLTVSAGVSTISGTLVLSNAGAILNISNASSFTVTGTTNNAGTVNRTVDNATTFTGLVTNTGTFNTSAVVTIANMVFTAGFTHTSGTFNVNRATFGAGATMTATTSCGVTNAFTDAGALTINGPGNFSFGATSTVTGALTLNTNLVYPGTVVTLNLNGGVSGTGTIDASTSNAAHILNLAGATNTGVGFLSGTGSTVNYNGTGVAQDVLAVSYNILNINSTGTKTLANNTSVTSTGTCITVSNGVFDLNGKTLTTSGNISITAGTFNVDDDAILQVANTKSVSITASGIFMAVGSSGHPATITRNTAGNYTVSQTGASSVFHALYAVFEYTNGNGVSITNGSIDATNKFDNCTFTNGSGTCYLNLSALNLGAGLTANNVTFNTGPTYNVQRTSGTGAITFADAAGTLAAGTLGEANDNDNTNPGTLVLWSTTGYTYYSQGTGLFSTLTNWNTIPAGGGSTPGAGKLTDGSSTFIVQNTDIVTLDQDVDIAALQVINAGTLTFGNNGTGRTMVVEGNFSTSGGTNVNVGATAATHTLTIKGNLDNNGTFNLEPASNRVTNVNFDATTGTIGGTITPIFNNVTFNSNAYSSVSYTSLLALDINGTVTINTNAIFNDGGFTHTIGGNWYQTNAATSFVATGSLVFDGASVQSICGAGAPYNVGATFNNVTINNGLSVTLNQACTFNGNFVVTGNTAAAAGAATQTFNKDFTVNSGSSYASGGTTLFNGTSAQSIDFTNCNFTALTFSNTGAKNTTGVIATAITGLTTISSGATVNGTVTYLTAGALRVDGTCNWAGTLTFSGTAAPNPGIYTTMAANSMSLGTADVIIDGQYFIGFSGAATANAVSVGGDLTILQNSAYGTYLVLSNNTTLTGLAPNSLIVGASGTYNTNLYCRGSNNFPTGFGTYNLDQTSFVRYDANMSQTVRGGITYGRLYLNGVAGNIKSADSGLDVNSILYVLGGVTLDLMGFNHTLEGDLNDNGSNPIVQNTGGTGTFTLDAANANQDIASGGSGTYTFNNFSIVQSAPSAARTKTILRPITLTGNFSATNPAGDATIRLNVTIGANSITGSGSSTFTLGSDVWLNVSHADFGTSTMSTFGGAKTLDPLSYVNYNGTAQTIANGFTYGGIYFSGSNNKTATMALDVNGTVNGNGGTFVDGGFAHTVAGDWLLPSGNYTSPTSVITLDGAAQNIGSGTSSPVFYSLVSAGTATKTQNGANVTINADFTINNGSTYDANTRDMNIRGNWSQGATGNFAQTIGGTVTFDGTTANQTLTSNATSYFNNILINKPTANRTLTVNSYLDVDNNLTIYGPGSPNVSALDGAIDFSNQSVHVGNNLRFYTASGLTATGSTLYLDGSNIQYIYFDNTAAPINNLELSNAGAKTLVSATGSVVDINGYVNISGTTLDGSSNGIDLTVAGDWTNTGVFQHAGRTTTFDGANQLIGQSSFGNVIFAGTGTKTLGGAITLANSLTISTNVTLDVSASNYSISVGGDWNNFAAGSVFVPHSGMVTFNGTGNQALSTGSTTAVAAGYTAIGAGKSFYDLVINKTAGNLNLGNGGNFGDLDVTNNLTVTMGTGSFVSNGYDIFLGGNFANGTNFNMSAQTGVMVLKATAGSKTFTSGNSATNTFRDIYVDASGATYSLQDNLSIRNNTTAASTTGLILLAGTFDVGSRSLTFSQTSNSNVINISAGATFKVGAGGYVYFSNANDVLNNGGTIQIVGNSTLPATFSRASTATTGYTVVQSSGTFHAKYYKFEYLNNATTENGVQITGGTIDATNNFSEGTFTNGFTSSQQYLDLSGQSSSWVAVNVSFNTGPLKNVKFTSGTGDVKFVNASGTFYGATNENDDGSATTGRIKWENGGIYWDGGAGDGLWNSAANWVGDVVPGTTDTVILDHSFVGAAYNVDLNSGANASVTRLQIDKQGSANAISLTLGGTNTLTVSENVNVLTGCSLIASSASNTITVGGNFTNSGTYTPGSSTLVLNPVSGTKLLTVGASTLNNLTINGAVGSIISLASGINLNGNLTITSGELDVTAGNLAIDLKGNWTVSGSGIFTGRSGTVTFSQSGPTGQTISGGTFYNLTTSSGVATSVKQITSSISVTNNLTIGANTSVDGGANTIYVGGTFTNNASTSGFSQTGAGTIYFNGTGNQAIENGSFASTFNNVVVTAASGNPVKSWGQSSTINANFDITGIQTLNMQTFTINGAGGANVFTIATSSTLRLMGTNNFPSGFETISLASNSIVRYQADMNQTIYNVPSPGYGSLTVARNSAGTWTKTAPATLIVQGALTIADVNTVLDCNTNSSNITLYGNLAIANGYVNTPTAPINWGTGTSVLNHVGTSGWNLDVDISTFNNLNISTTGGNATMSVNLTITGDVSVNSGSVLNMQSFTITGPGSKTFTLNNGSQLSTSIPGTTGVAFPTNFGTYSINSNSLVYLYGGSDQTIKTSNVTYGNFQINNSTKIVTLEAGNDFTCAGYFYQTTNNTPGAYATLADNGRNITIGGDAFFGPFTSSASTINLTFNGTSAQRIENVYSNATLTFPNVVFSGAGTKTLGDANDSFIIGGNLTINSGSPVTSARNISFNGSSWTNSGGSWSHTANTLTFNNAAAVAINVGVTNAFNALDFTGGGTFTFSTNGADINGAFTITLGTVNMGTLTHTIAGNISIGANTWTTTNANLTFDGGGQNIPGLTAKDIICANGGTKTMQGAWNIDDLTINPSVTLTTSASNYAINATGNWLNSGTFTSNSSTVTFNGATTPITVSNNTSTFYIANFSPTSPVTYSLGSASTTFRISSVIGTNAYLDVNGNTLIIGSNTATAKSLTVNGTLDVDANAVLRFDNQTSVVTMAVNPGAVFKLVGTSSQVATLTRQVQGGVNITIDGTIHARYYLIEYLANNGMNVTSSATLDPVNNFSDGTWSNIVTTAGAAKRYLILNCPDPGTTLANVTFNFSGTPTINTHYNVQRSNAATGSITFVDALGGNLGDYQYEDDGAGAPDYLTGKIIWPGVTSVTWTGAINTDWHTAGNWSPATVPTSAISANIPLVTNNPIISTGNADCKNLTISNGQLSISGGFDLTTAGDIAIGTGTGLGAVTIGSSGTTITCAGNWTRGTNGVFVHGSGTVVFTGSTGASTVTPLTSAFYNVQFNNSSSVFYLVGATVNFAGSVTVLAGQLYPNTNNYNINVTGDFACTGTTGTFSTVTPGTVTLNGTTQAIVDASFYNLTVSGTGVKTTTGNITIANVTTINSTLAAATLSSNIDFNGNVTISGSGGFVDGDNAHTFSGATWTGTGTYSGAGTVTFDRSGAQNVAGGTFNHLILNTVGSQVTFSGNVNLTGDLYVDNAINNLVINSGVTVISTTGTGTCTLESGESIYCRGTNSFPASFGGYDIQSTSTVVYDGSADQNIYGADYGNLTLANANTKTLLNDVYIKNMLSFGATGSILDVSTSNFVITIQGHWNNNGNGTFIPRTGEVVFNGTTADQYIQIGATATNPFNNVTVNKGAFRLLNWNRNVTIQGNLKVLGGSHTSNTYITYVGGNIDVLSGSLANSGTYYMNKPSGTATILTNGSTLNHLTLNGASTTFQCSDNLSIIGDFNLTAGTFDGNGKTVYLGDNGDGITIAGTYKVGPGGILGVGNVVTTTITATGRLEVVGSSGSIATVTRNTQGGAGSRYSAFQVNSGGQIAARYYLFEYMGVGGILVNSGAIIDNTNNFSDGTFSNGANNGVFLQVENNQRFTTANGNPINNVSFPVTPGGSSSNVKKLANPSDTLEFYNSTGAFSGEGFDSDANNYINWTGPITLTWDGSTSTDWYDATNWTASSGPDIVPTGAENVVIAAAVNQPIITVAGALTKNLTINLSANLTITTATAALNDLAVNGDITINGTLAMSTANDGMTITGNWTKATGGTVNITNGTVDFNGTSAKTINNGTANFGNVVFSNTGAYTLGATFTVTKDLTITSGSLDVSSTNYAVNIGGNFTNSSTFNPRNGKITFNASSGTKTINAGTTNYYDIDFNGGAGAIYQLSTNSLTLSRNCNIAAGSLVLNGQNLIMGDNVGGDFLAITGTLTVSPGSALKMGQSSSAVVNSGGVINVVGSSAVNIATITRHASSAGYYGFTINSGGTISAKYYLIEYINASGFVLSSGATINATNNFSKGTFANGASGGRYLQLSCDLGGGAGITADSVVFNTGPTYNCVRTSGAGNMTFHDASGTKGNFNYEQDDQAISPTLGLIRWTYTYPTATWTGNVSTQWDNILNWDIGVVPNSGMNAIIPDVSGSSGNNPLINTTSDSGTVLNLTIYNGGVLNLANNKGLDVYGDVTNAGTINVSAGSTSPINVKGAWSDNGTVSPGASVVTFIATSGSKTITSSAGSSFYSVTINSGASFTLTSAIDVNGNLTLTSGTLDVSTSNYAITVAGNITNTGTFVPRSGTVTLDGTSGTQTINTGSTAGRAFYNLTKSTLSTSTMALAANLDVDNDLTIAKGSVTGGAFTIYVAGNFNVSSSTSSITNASVVFDGTVTKTFTYTNATVVSFNNVTVNKTGAGKDLILANSIGLSGTLTMTSGDIIIGARNLQLGNAATISGGSSSSYVQADNSGFVRKSYNATGGAVLSIPIGDVDDYAPITFKLNSATLAGGAYVQFNCKDVIHPNYGSLSPVPANYITRYWDIQQSGVSGTVNYDFSMVYTTADVVGTESALMPGRYAGAPTNNWKFGPDFGTWTENTATNTVTWTGVTSIGSMSAIGYYNVSINSGPYSTGTNWSFGSAPGATDVAIIGAGTTITLGGNETNGNIIVNGTLALNGNTLNTGNASIVSGGTLTASAGSNLSLTGTFTNSGTFTANAGSTVTYAATSGSQCISGLASSITYANLTVAGTGVRTLCDNVRVNGNLTINSGTVTLNGNTYTVNLGGNLNNSMGTLNSTGSTFNFEGTTTIASGDTLSSCVIKPSSTLTFPAGTMVIGNTFQNDGTFNHGSGTAVFGGTTSITGATTTITFNNLTIGGSLTAPTGGVTVNGNWVNNGTFNSNNTTTTFAGTTTMSGTSSSTFTGVTITGTLNGGSHNFSLTGNWVSTAGTFNEGTSTVTFNGTGAQSINAPMAGLTYYNLIINKATGLLSFTSSSSDINVTNQLTMTSGNVDQNGADFFLGTTSAASLSRTAGVFYNGHFNRFVPSGAITSNSGSYYGLFPVGDTLTGGTVSYRPLTLDGSVTTGGLVYAQNFSNGTGTTLVNVVDPDGSVNVTYVRDQYTEVDFPDANFQKLAGGSGGNNSTFAANLTLTATFSGLPNVGSVADLRLTVHDGVSYGFQGNHVATTGTVANPTLSRTNLSGRNGIRGAWRPGTTNKSATPLPVELLTFTARVKSNKQVLVEWATATEVNNDYFVVEKSKDGVNYENVQTLEGAGNSLSTLHYSLTDLQPFAGSSYYRLKQVDFDGKSSYSSVVKVEIEESFDIAPSITLSPNPVEPNSQFNLEIKGFDEQEEVLLVILDINGKEVAKKVVVTDNTSTSVTTSPINAGLAPGVYFIVASSNETIIKKKLIVN